MYVSYMYPYRVQVHVHVHTCPNLKGTNLSACNLGLDQGTYDMYGHNKIMRLSESSVISHGRMHRPPSSPA